MTQDVALEHLAAQYGISLPEGDPAGAGYMGCSAAGMVWKDQHRQLERMVSARFPARSDYETTLRETAAGLTVELTDSWAALDMEECAARLRQLPGYRLFQ